MGRFVLDTTVLIDSSRSREPVRTKLRGMIEGGDEFGVCAVQVAEFFTGVSDEDRSVWEPLFAALRSWQIDQATAARAGGYRCASARRGRQLSVPDALIAAARRERAVVVADNARHFPMADVQTSRSADARALSLAATDRFGVQPSAAGATSGRGCSSRSPGADPSAIGRQPRPGPVERRGPYGSR